MKLLELKVMRGPNYWSAGHHQLIVLKLETETEEKNSLPEKIRQAKNQWLPLDHFSGELAPEDLVGIVAVQLQKEAGYSVDYFSHKKAADGKPFYSIFAFANEEAGIFAGERSIEFLNAISKNEKYDILKEIGELKSLRRRRDLGATTSYILDEVKKRRIPFRRFDRSSLLLLGYGTRQKKIRTAVADSTSGLGIELAGDKEETKEMLALFHIPVPKGILVYSEAELKKRINELQYPLVVKPLGGNQGRGVTTQIRDMDKLLFGYHMASKTSDAVIVEEFIEGFDHRFLVINYKLVAVAKRVPAHITGDGRSTVKQLIDEVNREPGRGYGEEHFLSPIKIDEVTQRIFSENKLTEESILEEGRILILKDTANISAGGTAEDVTEFVHPETRFMVERIAKLFGLDICGIDIMTTSVEAPLTRQTGAVIEVNAGPGIRMHANPQRGKSRNVAAPIVDMLFPSDFHPRIPIVSITGTNGKTTVTRLIAHLSAEAGYKPGYTTTDGIYINGHRIVKGDCAGFQSAQDVLFDPTVDIAVLETARGGILRSGLAFDECDIGIVTNVTRDHLGLKDINTLEEMAGVKSVVPKSVRKEGYAILNADDDLVYTMRKDLKCNVALFSMHADNPRILQHLAAGGIVSVIDNGELQIRKGKEKLILGSISAIPLTFEGRSEAMIKNLMPAVLTAEILGFQPESIKEGLKSFIPSPGLTPGRMNAFNFGEFTLVLDYAHNADGFLELRKFVDKTPASRKIGIIGVAGDRLDEDIIKVGSIAAQTFGEIIIRHDKDMRGRAEEELTRLLTEGIRKENRNIPVEIISDEMEAIEKVIARASPDSLIVLTSEKVDDAIELITKKLSEGRNKQENVLQEQ